MKRIIELLSKIIIVLPLLIIGNCKNEDDENENEQAKIKRSQEVRDSLKGELTFYRRSTLSINKVIAKYGGSGLNITNNVAYVGPKWSQDGSKIAVMKLKYTPQGSSNGWYLIIVNAGNLEQNEWFSDHGFAEVWTITWSPDNQFIAILFNDNRIQYIDITTGEKTESQLIAGIGEYYTSIAWRPANSKIAISLRTGDLSNTQNSIWLFDAFDNDPKKDPNNLVLTIQETQYLDRVEYLDWSMDGLMLAYSESSPGHIYFVNYDGTNNREIILKGLFKDETVYGFAPSWASNNKQIVYTGVTNVIGSTLVFGLFVTDITGSYKVNININGELPDWY